jgi:hypothetical protein
VTVLTNWENFYVIVGSSAGALTGLMFVVITLISGESERQRRNPEGDLAAYGTPNVFHFCAVLVLSALLSAPWESLTLVGALLVLSGLIGVIYAGIILRRMIRRARLQGGYTPVVEDWLWFGAFPLSAYVALAVVAILFASHPAPAMFVIGGAMVLLLLVGIHNAWDTVTFLAVSRNASSDKAGPVEKGKRSEQ